MNTYTFNVMYIKAYRRFQMNLFDILFIQMFKQCYIDSKTQHKGRGILS